MTSRVEQEEIEKRLNIILLRMADLQEKIWDDLENLNERGLLKPGLEEHVHQVMSDVSYWIDQCTTTTESPSVLLRRMEVHLERLIRIKELSEKILE